MNNYHELIHPLSNLSETSNINEQKGNNNIKLAPCIDKGWCRYK